MLNLIYTILCIACLCMGFFYGRKIEKKEEIKNPVEVIKKQVQEKKDNKNKQEEINRLNTIWNNINDYEGTGLNQKEVE